jgi:hypothetical protein
MTQGTETSRIREHIRRAEPLIRRVIVVGLLAWGMVASLAQMDVGLADNGDFWRIMYVLTSGPVHIEPNHPDFRTEPEKWRRRFFKYYIPYWKWDAPEPLFSRSHYSSSAYLLWFPGALLNRIFWSPHVLYLGVLSLPARLLLLTLLALVLGFLQKTLPPGHTFLLLTLGLPLTLVFSDGAYLATLNSFYCESAALVFGSAFLVLVVAVRRLPVSPTVAGAILLGSAFLVASVKAPFVYWMSVAVLALVLVFRYRRWRLRPSRWAWVGALTGLLGALALYITRPLDLAFETHAYNRLFYGVLLLSDRPSRHLWRLGVPYAGPCIGMHAHTKVGRQCAPQVRSALHVGAFLRVVMEEPVLLPRLVVAAAREMHYLRVEVLGYYAEFDPRAGTPTVPFRPWSHLKAASFPRGLPLILCLLGCFVLGAIGSRSPSLEGDLGTVACVGSCAVLADIAVAALGDGLADIRRHLLLANFIFDLTFLVTLNQVLLILRRRVAGGPFPTPTSPEA